MSFIEYNGTLLETNKSVRVNAGPVLGVFYLRVDRMWVNTTIKRACLGVNSGSYLYETLDKGIMSIYDTHMKLSKETWTFITNGYL